MNRRLSARLLLRIRLGVTRERGGGPFRGIRCTVALHRKPSVELLGIDLAAQTWRSSGTGDGAIEVAFVQAKGTGWVLMRVAGDPGGRVLVYNRYEWECFVDGAKKGEFDGEG